MGYVGCLNFGSDWFQPGDGAISVCFGAHSEAHPSCLTEQWGQGDHGSKSQPPMAAWINQVMLPSFWKHRFKCMDQPVLTSQASTAWTKRHSTSKQHNIDRHTLKLQVFIAYECVLLQDGVSREEQHQPSGAEWKPSWQTSEDAGGWNCVSQLQRYRIQSASSLSSWWTERRTGWRFFSACFYSGISPDCVFVLQEHAFF